MKISTKGTIIIVINEKKLLENVMHGYHLNPRNNVRKTALQIVYQCALEVLPNIINSEFACPLLN